MALSCWLLGPSPAVAEWSHSWAVGCLWVRLGFFFLEYVEVCVLSLVVHCWGGGFLKGCTSVEVFWFVVFRRVRSSAVSTHSTGRFGVGQDQRVLAQGMRDGL